MRWITPIVREIFRLFVDDGSFALIIVLWLAAMASLQPLVPLPLPWRGPMLFTGLALALVWSCLRHVTRHVGRHQ